MIAWKEEAIRKIDIATEKIRCAILSTPDNAYNYTQGEIDIWLCRDESAGRSSVKYIRKFKI